MLPINALNKLGAKILNKKHYYSDKNRNKTTPFNPKQITLKKGRLLLSALPLTACANNPQSDFVETSANIFEIQTDTGGTFLQGTSQENLTVTGGAGNDLITTGDGDDILNGGEGNDTLNGGNGNDTLDGGAGDDILSGGAGDDILLAGEGNNILYGGTGDDILNDEDSGSNIFYGGEGNDTLNGWDGNDILIGGAGADVLTYGKVSYEGSPAGININLESNTASGGDAEGDILTSVQHVVGSEFDDILIGNDQFNFFTGNAGADYLDGGNGRGSAGYINSPASVIINLATNTASGGDAEGDVLINIASISGSDFNDTLTGNDQGNSLTGNDGDDVLSGGGGIDNLRGGSGNDTLNGGDGDDTLIGDIGNDTLNGDDGDDHLYGWDGNDIINGGAGDDIIFGNAGADVLDGGDGIDSVRYHDSLAGVSINLAMNTASGGDAEGDIISNIENVYGSVYDDTIIGDDQDNYLSGGNFLGAPSGNDTLVGGGGNDTLFAGQGDQDTLDGGTGDDMFIIDKLIYFEDVEAPIDVIEGGSGTDALYFRGYYPEPIEYDFDFSMIDASNIEILDFSNNNYSYENNITLTLADVLEVTDDNDELRIDGGSNVSVTSTDQGWVQGTDQNIDGETYNVFTSGGATLLIDEDIQQTIS